MRRARRNNLIAGRRRLLKAALRRGVLLLLLLLAAGPCVTQSSAAGGDVATGQDQTPLPESYPSDREAAARRQIEDSERVRAMQVDAQRIATEQAAQALAEEQRLTVEQSAAFDRLKGAEAAVSEMTEHLRDLNERRAATQSRIDKTTEALRPLLPILIRMSLNPIETLLSAPVPFEDAVRGIVVLRAIARQAAADAHGLIEDREALDAATKAAVEVASQLAAAEAARSFEAESLAHQLAETRERREAAEQEAVSAARRAAAEAARAGTLRSMLQILETQRRLEEARAAEDLLRAERDQKDAAAEAARLRQAALTRPAGVGTIAANAKPSGQMIPPVTGTLVRGWADPEDGEPATGQSWQTDAGAWVVAPCGGTVAFAEPFHGYGLLIIIDCGGGYHVVLGGLDQISVVPGHAVQANQPIATMRAATPAGVASGGATDTPPILYFELRKAGHPINPAPWLKPEG
jgi:murein hydrolase activator